MLGSAAWLTNLTGNFLSGFCFLRCVCVDGGYYFGKLGFGLEFSLVTLLLRDSGRRQPQQHHRQYTTQHHQQTETTTANNKRIDYNNNRIDTSGTSPRCISPSRLYPSAASENWGQLKYQIFPKNGFAKPVLKPNLGAHNGGKSGTNETLLFLPFPK